MSAPGRDVREVVREEPLMHRAILRALAGGARTVPDIAAAIGRPSHEVMFWVMGMRRYGLVREVKEVTADGYYRYGAVEKVAS